MKINKTIVKEAKKKQTTKCQHFWWPKESYRPTFTTETTVDKVYCMHCLEVRSI